MKYAFALLLVLAGCPLHNPAPTPIDPPYPASAISEACESLRRVGCPEGFGSVTGATCERTLALADDLRPLPVVCWAQAKDQVAAKSCGSLRCSR
jgi:hypothetical protein